MTESIHNDSVTLNDFKKDIENKILEIDPGRFPIEVFSKPIQEIITEYNRTLNFPIDYTSISILFATSIGIGNTHFLEVKKEFVVNAVIYCALVGKPGTMKTHPLSFAIAPILNRDERTTQQYKDDFTKYQEYLNLNRKDREQMGIDKMSAPVYKKYLCQDYTPEVLGQIHDFNRRGIGIYHDELAAWIKNFGRYNSGSEGENWLKNWSRQAMLIDRKGGDKIFIKHPFISVIGGIQPGVLDIISKDGRDQNGFIDRILFAFPNDMDKAPWNNNEIDEIHRVRYHGIIDKLLDIDENTNKTLKFDDLAKQRLFEWNQEFTRLINESPDSHRGPLTKLETYAPRFCLILQLLKWACNEGSNDAIDLDTVNSALKLVDYFKHNALKVNQYFNTTPVERLPENIRSWYESLPTKEFKTSVALETGIRAGMSERNIKYYLADISLFRRLAYGKYLKMYA